MKKYILSALFLITAALQTGWAQGFRVYKTDGTIAQFSLRTDSIVFYDGIGSDVDFGPFTPVNQCIVGTWYKTKSESVTFNDDGTTDYVQGATYEFMPYQGSLVIFNDLGTPIQVLRVPRLTANMLLLVTGASPTSFDIYSRTCPVQLVTNIALNKTSLTLQINDTMQLTATVQPSDADNKELIWESDNENIAIVDQTGKVTAKAKGTCTITCSAKDGSGIKAECQVTIIQLVTGIILSETSLSLTLPTNATHTLTATVVPSTASNLGITWSSNNTSVASVDQTGKITAKAKGTCTITCGAKDGSGVNAECQVTVIQLVTGITLNKTSVSIQPNDIEFLTATVLPDNANNKTVTWKSSDEEIAEVNKNGRVIANANGICTITCRAIDGSGVTAECEVTVNNPITPEEHEYVDLGLPSGSLWATCNIGASSPEEYGDYFAWGETTTKSDYSWDTYKYCKGSRETLTKYCRQSDYGYNGFTDALTELLPEDDAATANWGEDWQMPSQAQHSELINSSYTITEWTTMNGIDGRKITSKTNGKSIFLPAPGQYFGTTLDAKGSAAYWSRSLRTSYSYGAYELYFRSDLIVPAGYIDRYAGQSVRPVRKQ